jgi:hypothetical protein
VASRKRQFWFSAEGESHKDRTTRRFSVYRPGQSVYITTLSPHAYEYLVPSRVSPTERDVVREIGIVFEVSKVRVTYPELRERPPRSRR